MRTTIILISLVAALLSAPSWAGAISDTYVIPAAAHTRGAGGELWQSDLQLFNPNATPVTVDVVFIDASGTSRALGTSTTVTPYGTAMLRDVVGSAGGQGAIVLSGNEPFVVTSRSYATTPRGTYGESVTAAAEFIDGTTDAFVTGLTTNDTTRTNVGIFAAAGRNAPMTVTITIFDAGGTVAGTLTMTIPAGQMTVTQLPLTVIATRALEGASARVRISGGNGIATAYASIIDNATSDSTFIAASSGVLAPGIAAAILRSHLQ